ncbi:VanZ family protein [Anoxybacteroides tepidamans]|uniref:VanZ family protein n=1 Tax=Anoxybacteroides tepidamans TaxID=265948 RepID=UPI000B078ABE|nr:VanZ family protein [Anoxybacillus tepidamans]
MSFIAYLLILTKMVLFKGVAISDFHLSNRETYWHSSNFVPFKTIAFYLFFADVNLDIKVENVAGNVVGFIPFGFFLPLCLKKCPSWLTVLLATMFLSLSYETVQQLFVLGNFDIDDILLNTFGGVLGYAPGKWASLRVYKNESNFHAHINGR